MKNQKDGVYAISPDALPHNWGLATIEAMVGNGGVFCDGDWVESKDQDPGGNVRLIQLADIGDGVYKNKSSRYLTESKAAELRCTFLQAGDVLIARMPDPLGRACIFPGDSRRAVTAVDVCIVRPSRDSVDSKWLMFSANAGAVRSAVASLQSGSTRKRISRKNLARIVYPLPPLAEQKRIVAKIEELFTRLDAGVDALKKIKAQLKRYRQAVLKGAFEGRLTADWRQKNKETLEPAAKLLKRIAKERERQSAAKRQKRLPSLDTPSLPDLPEGWEWTRLRDVALVASGQTPKGLAGVTGSGEIPFYKVSDMNTHGNETCMVRANVNLTAEEAQRLGIHVREAGSVIFPKRGGAIHTNKKRILSKPAGYDLNIMGVLLHLMPSKFFYYWIHSFDLTSISDGSNVPQINHKDVEPLPFPVAPLQEQHLIVEETERHFSIADDIERTIDRSLKESDRLRQSILKRAFEGKLVPQDPNDEPAEKLLERIKAEEAKSEIMGRPAQRTRA